MSGTDPAGLAMLAHAICPKLKPWIDHADTKPRPCKQCGPFDTKYGKAIPMCLGAAQDIAAAVIAFLASPEVVEQMAQAMYREAVIKGISRPWKKHDEETREHWRRCARAALRAACGEGVERG